VSEFKPWKPCPVTREIAHALRALTAGTATEYQQKTALQWLVEVAAMTYDMTYMPDSARDSDFAQGRRFVGLQIVKLLNLTPQQLEKL
jgi:hypothetical protein